MLSILLTIFVLLVVNFGTGFIISHIFRVRNAGFVLISFVGMIGIALLETVLAFFFPLNFVLEIALVALGVLGAGWFWKTEKSAQFKINFDFWFYFFLGVIILATSFSPYLFDHYSYYVPTISYLRDFGFVKGISNLDLLLGQCSFWHIYQAGFSHIIDPFLKINAYLSVLFLIYIYEKKQLFLFIFLPIFLLFVQQPSPDLPILILCLIVINEISAERENKLLLYLSLFAVCVKPVVFWLPLFVILNNFGQKKIIFKSIIPVFIFGFLVIMKNLWLFGFPIFPVAVFDFNLPWKPSHEILSYSSQIGQMKSYDMKYSYQQISGFNIFDKIFHWFTIGFKSVFNVGIIISLSIVGFFAFSKKSRFYYFLFICLIIKFILIVSFSAQYRFFLDVYIVAMFLLFKNLSASKSIFATLLLSIIILMMFIFPVSFKNKFHSGSWMFGFHWSQFYKPKEVASEKAQWFQIGNLKFKATKGLIYKNSFPTISLYWLKIYQYYQIFPQLSDAGLIQKNLNEGEIKELKKIISQTEKQHSQIP
ncbi:MAG: hypothetical protein L6262_03165 [Weeksellaceae bacterium]|nr:hypothetical protein [Weeksellaceae bacterium]